MSKLDIEEIKRNAVKVFNTKTEMLKYIKKASFRKEWSYSHYEMEIAYESKKWFVRWK